MKTKNTNKKSLLICGNSILADSNLINQLKNDFLIITCTNVKNLPQLIKRYLSHILLIEIRGDNIDYEIIKKISTQNQEMPIIVVGDKNDMNMTAKAFNFGAWDFFRIPYYKDLLIDRVKSFSQKIKQ